MPAQSHSCIVATAIIAISCRANENAETVRLRVNAETALRLDTLMRDKWMSKFGLAPAVLSVAARENILVLDLWNLCAWPWTCRVLCEMFVDDDAMIMNRDALNWDICRDARVKEQRTMHERSALGVAAMLAACGHRVIKFTYWRWWNIVRNEDVRRCMRLFIHSVSTLFGATTAFYFYMQQVGSRWSCDEMLRWQRCSLFLISHICFVF